MSQTGPQSVCVVHVCVVICICVRVCALMCRVRVCVWTQVAIKGMFKVKDNSVNDVGKNTVAEIEECPAGGDPAHPYNLNIPTNLNL